jgi:uncharacterized cupin superfamily protein
VPQADIHGQLHHGDLHPRCRPAAEPGGEQLADLDLWSDTFPWTYDERETCLLLEGDVTVTPAGGEPVRFGAGDLVVFVEGLSCTWDVHVPVRKHYRFG